MSTDDPKELESASASASATLSKEDEEDEDSSSDVEIEGIDQEGDDEDDDDDDDDDDDNNDNNNNDDDDDDDDDKDNDDDNDKLAKKEAQELEEARKERMELLAAERKAITKTSNSHKNNSTTTTTSSSRDHTDVTKATKEERLQYLLSQSEVFAHFLAGSVATNTKKSNNNSGNRGKKGRMTEAEEDAQLLKSAQSKRRTIRLDVQPSNLASHCKMHPYQLEGLNWLIKLHDHGINGILADEMGLGKTLQTISLLAYLRESRGVKGPHLCIVPKSVVGNWIKELKRWCPSIRPIKMLANKIERKRIVKEYLTTTDDNGGGSKKYQFDVLVTSYEGVLKEKSALAKVQWKYLIIDEAHRIKNENSSLSKVVRIMNTEFRLLITGTPLQNNLHELWALLNFLLPDIFGSAEDFDEWFDLSGSVGQENVIKKLHTVLRPFMIRRVKKDVACGLPPKKETKLYVGLTDMQQQWYKKILSKDASELNALGGPDKVRLLNILMQLRKVCNHPYLFDGAEAGPPYTDGPHLWENSGKMMLLHKLLPKLKQKGSRVLIFSQMTRVLDIMEDYLRLQQYEYCRIDGNTDGELRDSQMETFNEPDSSKFAFLLSTRAGGLGINLATADIVILFDSDWNPQVDLQAMDRAHRIGQTKPVQVFRFISEGTVEEKIIERADRKLFLDAAVIQQGRLAEQHSTVDKDHLMKMVKFGADQILSGKGGTYTDQDIDALIAKGEEKTEAMQAKLKTDAQHNLASFSLLGDDGTDIDTFAFDGENYRDANKKKSGTFINLPQRERKRNYDVNEYFRDAMNQSGGGQGATKTSDSAPKKRKKGPAYQDFQFYNRDRLEYFNNKEREMAEKKAQNLAHINSLREAAKSAPSLNNQRVELATGQSREELLETASKIELTVEQFCLTPEEEHEKKKLLAEGFPDWSKKDFRAFTTSLELHGRFDILNIVKDVTNECGKSDDEVKRYFVSFWLNYKRIAEWRKMLDKIEKGEKKILRLRQIRDAIREKIERHIDDRYGYLVSTLPEGSHLPTSTQLLDDCWKTIKLTYVQGTKNRAYAEEEDAFLLCMMHRHGFGSNERIRLEIRRAWQFRFNWFFKSRSSHEIQKRCEAVVKMVEKEVEELRKQDEEEEAKQDVKFFAEKAERERQETL